MTTLVEDVQALLNPLAAGGAWYGGSPQQAAAALPYIVWFRVDSTANVAMGGASQLQNTRVQIDIYSRSLQQAEGLAATLTAALAASAITNVPLSSFDQYEPDIKAYRISKDYSLWATN